MYKKGTGNDKQGKDAGNRTLCPYRNFSQAIMECINDLAFTPLSTVHSLDARYDARSHFFSPEMRLFNMHYCQCFVVD